MSMPAGLIYGSVSAGGKVKPEHRAIGLLRGKESYLEGQFECRLMSNRGKAEVVLYDGPDEAECFRHYDSARKVLDLFRGYEQPYKLVREWVERIQKGDTTLLTAFSEVTQNAEKK